MFDEIIIDNEKVQVFFDIENFKFHVNKEEYSKLENEYIQISQYVLFLSDNIKYNNNSYEYDVLFYIHCYYREFDIDRVSRILFSSKEISYLLYSNDKRISTKNYSIKNDSCEVKITIKTTKKVQKWNYSDIKLGGSIGVDIIKCDNWITYGKIVNSIIDCVNICSLNRRNNDIEILLEKKKNENNIDYVGKIVFPKKVNNFDDSWHSMGNISIIKSDFKKIVSTLIDTPLLSHYIIPKNTLYNTQLDFYKLYACFEYEYKKINRDDMYTREQNREIKRCMKMKKDIKNILINSSIDVTEHYYSQLDNYNPLEGHRQRLINAINYSKRIMNTWFKWARLEEIEKDFTDFIYKTRINIIHEPSNDIYITNNGYMYHFNVMVYGLFLKRCGITNKRVNEICDDMFAISL